MTPSMPVTDKEKLELLLFNANPPTDITFVERMKENVTSPIAKNTIEQYIEVLQGTRLALDGELYDLAKDHVYGNTKFAAGGTIGSVKEYFDSINIDLLPEEVQVFIRANILNSPVAESPKSLENESFEEIKALVDSLLKGTAAQETPAQAEVSDTLYPETPGYENAKFKVEVHGVGDPEGHFVSNALRFNTQAAAEKYARDLSSRWGGMDDWRVVPVEAEQPMTTYKFRAEGENDANLFYETNKAVIHNYKTETAGTTDVIATFDSTLSLDEIIELMQNQADSHVMYETVKPISEYTGDRDDYMGAEPTNVIKINLSEQTKPEGFELDETVKMEPAEIMAQYTENEANNLHAENLVLLAEHFGTNGDLAEALAIKYQNEKLGHLPLKLYEEQKALSQKLFPMLKQALGEKEPVVEEVEELDMPIGFDEKMQTTEEVVDLDLPLENEDADEKEIREIKRIEQDNGEVDERAQMEDYITTLESALEFTEGKDTELLKTQIEELKATLEFLPPSKKATGGNAKAVKVFTVEARFSRDGEYENTETFYGVETPESEDEAAAILGAIRPEIENMFVGDADFEDGKISWEIDFWDEEKATGGEFGINYNVVYEKPNSDIAWTEQINANSKDEAKEKFKLAHPTCKILNIGEQYAKGGSAGVGEIVIKPKHAHRDDVAVLNTYLDDNSWSYKRAKAPNSELDYFVVSTVGVHRDEVAEIKRWLKEQMWDWETAGIASENKLSVKVYDDTQNEISGGYSGKYFNQELDEFIAENGIEVISAVGGKRIDTSGYAAGAIYTLSDNGKYDTSADFLDAIESAVSSVFNVKFISRYSKGKSNIKKATGGEAGEQIKVSFYKWGQFQEEEEMDLTDLPETMLSEDQLVGFDIRPEDVGKNFYALDRDIDEDEDGVSVKRAYAYGNALEYFFGAKAK